MPVALSRYPLGSDRVVGYCSYPWKLIALEISPVNHTLLTTLGFLLPSFIQALRQTFGGMFEISTA